MTSSPGSAEKQRVTLEDDDLPPLFRACDKASLGAQRRFLRVMLWQLWLLVIAAAAGGVVWKFGDRPVDWAGALAAVAFMAAAVLEAYVLKEKPDQIWYEGRAAAESAKTLAWRYAVGGKPFPLAGSDGKEVDELMVRRIREILRDLKGAALVEGQGPQITNKMRAIRAETLETRKFGYEKYRLEDQQNWYSGKAKWNEVRASRWRKTMLFVELAGVAGGVIKGLGIAQFSLLALAAAVIAVLGTWLQTKQHQTLARAYGVAAQELASIRSLLNTVEDESAWSRFVQDAEEAISREHTLWRASRGVADGYTAGWRE